MKTEHPSIVKAKGLWRNQEDQAAIDLLLSSELASNADALCLVGTIYDSAEKWHGGISRSTPKARKYWKLAMELGCSTAPRELAAHYHLGDGVKTNNEKAESYLLLAVERENSDAKWDLANLYYQYRPEKIGTAISLFEQLIDENEWSPNSHFYLGITYLRGKGVPKDTERAISHFKAGVDLNGVNCCFELSRLYTIGEGVNVDYERAIEILKIAAKNEIFRSDAQQRIEAIEVLRAS